jgi:AAHS family 4-hydroxybenzoate transporter-like MFS transporter
MPPSAPPAQVRIADVIDGSKIGALQVNLYILCAACMVMAGFDVQMMGYVGPAIIQEWKIPGPSLGTMLAAGNFGVLVGALVLTMFADTIGRRPLLIGATVFFSVVTILTGMVESVQQMVAARFIAGVGLGSIIPNGSALIGEYSPRRLRVTLIACISVGFTAGGAIAGFVGAWLIPAYGWRSMFYLGGAIPLVIAALMFFWLPESLQFLVLRRKHLDKVRVWLKQIDRTVPVSATTELVVQEENRGGVPAMHLFREGRALGTVLLWVINFMNIFNLYVLAGWLPTVATRMGYSTRTGVLVGTTLQVGGTLGTFWLTWFIAKWGFIRVLTACFTVAALSIALIGQPGISLLLLYAAVFIAGSCIVGGQPTVNALSAGYYPTYLRSTGIGWGLGVGRVGAIIGPLLIGELIRRQWSMPDIFRAVAIPALISAVLMLSLRWVMKPAASASAPVDVVAH